MAQNKLTQVQSTKKKTMNVKKLLFVVLLVSASGVNANQFETILKSGVIRVGVSLFEPWAIQKKDGSLYGHEIQISKHLARDMGVKPEFKVVDWENIISALEDKEFDIIISGMAITPSRALRVNFSNAYGGSGISIVANLERTKNTNSVGELNLPNVKIGAVSGTVAEKVAKRVFYRATVETFIREDEAVKAILAGDIHALVASSPEPKFLELQHPKTVDVPLSRPLLSYKTGMAVNKGEQEFLNYLNAWITSKQADGWLQAKDEYWFNTLRWKKD